jgi:hypothetical protein
MGQNALQIANIALSRLGARSLDSLSEDSTNGRHTRLRYPSVRDMLLRDHVWAFAKKYQSMAPTAAVTDLAPWAHKFTIPSDCGRILSISRSNETVAYERIANEIFAVESILDIRYVRAFGSEVVDDAFIFPDDFGEAAAAYLAAQLAIPISQNRSLYDLNMQDYRERIAMARFNGATERYGNYEQNSTWLDAHDNFTTEVDIESKNLAL